ncbi:jg6194 [Pararge aegeria aegeria]|uniref:Jg6194 protein n=1 Tax=Pararge aegeria aegeria TaxID=348720 RepID=A0A8S4S7M3_9NEOP|nr:jg6194 [Pararge aegeria aegeria]
MKRHIKMDNTMPQARNSILNSVIKLHRSIKIPPTPQIGRKVGTDALGVKKFPIATESVHRRAERMGDVATLLA